MYYVIHTEEIEIGIYNEQEKEEIMEKGVIEYKGSMEECVRYIESNY